MCVALLGGAATTGWTTASRSAPADADWRPFADYEDTGWIVMSAGDNHDTGPLKHAIARHLPANVSILLYGHSDKAADRQRILAAYGAIVGSARVGYVALPRAKQGFWSRDALPVPLVTADGTLRLVDARHWEGFEPDAAIGRLFSAPVDAHPHRFEGGNFVASDRGDCVVVNSKATAKIPDATFSLRYGCRTLTRLPERGGIGHADERARFVSASTILTDTPEYEPVFGARGWRVIRLPRPAGRYETYLNALIVNGTAFVPQFGRPADAEALRVYDDLGFTVVGLDSRRLSARGKGSLHCLAMNYPRIAIRP